MEEYIGEEMLNEVIRTYDILLSGGVRIDSVERKDGAINLFFRVDSRTEKRKEPYWVGLPLTRKKGSKKEYEIRMEEAVHALCPEYDRNAMCHHILASAVYTVRHFREIRKTHGLRGINLVSKYRPLPISKNL